jgi:hypothetical protein
MQNPNPQDQDPNPNLVDQAELDKIVQARVEEALKEIKGKLDSAYASRDEAVRKLTATEQTIRQKELETLEAAGKTEEALKLRLVSAEERAAQLESQIRDLNRDQLIANATGNLEFRNDRSREMALRDITASLVIDKDGNWVHKTGAQLKDFVKAYAKDPDNAFLFRAAPSSGAGGQGGQGAPQNKKKLTEMTTAELLAAAQNGQFGTMGI